MSRAAPVDNNNLSCANLTKLIRTNVPAIKNNLGTLCPDIQHFVGDLVFIPVAINGDGDCFFHALTVWYELIHNISVNNLRQIVLDNLQQAIFEDRNGIIDNSFVEFDIKNTHVKNQFFKDIGPGKYTNVAMDLLLNIVSVPEYNLLPNINGITPRLCIFNESQQGTSHYCNPQTPNTPQQETITLYKNPNPDHYSLLLTKDQAEIIWATYTIRGGKRRRHNTKKRRRFGKAKTKTKNRKSNHKQTKRNKSSSYYEKRASKILNTKKR